VDTSACDLTGIQDLLKKLHVTEQQPVKKEKKHYMLHRLKTYTDSKVAYTVCYI